MPLSSSVIKNTKVIAQGKKEIITESNIEEKQQSLEEIKDIIKNNGNENIDKFDEIAKAIIEKAKSEAEDIRVKAINDAETMKNEAHNKGYEEGKQQGYNDAYNETIGKSKAEADNIMSNAENNASNLVNSAKIQYEKYLLDKQVNIKELALFIAKQILKREVKEEQGIDDMIYDAVSTAKNSALIIIKCSSLHYNALSDAVELWKKQIPLKGEIFVIEDNFIENDSAIIEKDNGKIELSISIGLEKIKEELMN
ncbi:hypothetical protein [Clostridium pasteurianum]|uniref:Flagellar biosynthesis/type III secretory pathway protein n=1 Tax=Clostridium pasteurianum BC1 TaxID=86416 RepID=R4K5C6_CLOPA|nr:hypothetical protein [Clostridium pasteurianum]AGK97773.1 hypothetical protein Clopa_2935 [Clostridium pasteurianum BC1]